MLGKKGGKIRHNKELKIGKKYKRADLGITETGWRMSELTVRGELFSFFTIESIFHNRIEDDGFVYECRGEYGLIPVDKRVELHRHVFLKEEKGSYYTYLGVGKYEERYHKKCDICNKDCNKVFW